MVRRKHFCSTLAFLFAALSLGAADGGKSGAVTSPAADPSAGSSRRAPVPPVLRKTEPDDSHFVVLPGAARPTAPVAAASVPTVSEPVRPRPFHAPAFTPTRQIAFVGAPKEPQPPQLSDIGRPALKRPIFVIYPAEFEQDSGMFCQKQIGKWREDDAAAVLGSPAANRPAYGDKHSVNGLIYAFNDPTNRYKQLELDFDGDTGMLRTVFVYPWKMSWVDCRRLWGTNVSAADANQGRRFYSYLNRRVDVLVDATGKVISIGLY